MQRGPESWRADRLILHIGAPRTGSSTIQLALAASRKALAAQGFLVPQCLDRTFVPAMAPVWPADVAQRRIGVTGWRAVGALRRDLAAALRREVDAHRPHTLLLSSEQLFDRLDTPGVRRRLQRFLAPFATRIEVLVYLRRQDQAIWSRHLNALRLGRGDAWVTPGRMQRLYDYERRLRPWARRFGADRMTVKPYDRNAFPSGSVLHDYLAIAGIPVDAIRDPERQHNRGLDSVKAEFARRITAHLGHRGDPDSMRDDLNWVIDRVEGGWTPSRLPAREAEAILALYAGANERLARHWGDGGAFFGAEIDGDDGFEAPLTVDDAMEIAAQLWMVKAGQVRHLRKRVEKLGG